MASVISYPNGRFAVQFTNAEGARPIIRLGKSTRKFAEEVRGRVEYILSCQILNHPLDVDTSVWLSKLKPVLTKRFAAAGLVDTRPDNTLAAFCDYCIKHFGGKNRTQLNYGHTKHNLVKFFGPDRLIHVITKGDTREWQKWLLSKAKRRYKGEALAPTTASKRIKVAKQFFAFGVEKHWIPSNPFDGIKGLVDSNDDRQAFVDEVTIRQVLDEIADPKLRLMVALVRFGGLRCPSEIGPLRWEWINWDQETMQIYAPKTERYQGGKWRIIPIFARLRPFLDEAWDAAPPRATFVCPLNGSGASYWNRLERACRRAGVEPWPKLWHNLRASLQTELEEQGYSLIAITKWLGNSPSVAKKHYLQVTKEQFRRAIQGDEPPRSKPKRKSAAKSAARLRPAKTK